MKYINKFNLFESSTDINSDVSEKIENCKDIVETFNESNDDYKISSYKNGWFNTNSFTSVIVSDKDKVCIIFDLCSNKYIDESHNRTTYTTPITNTQIDETINLLNKSKNLISKLEFYCNEIKFKVIDRSCKFTLLFENTDSDSKITARVDHIYKNCLRYFKDNYMWHTRYTLSNDYNSELYQMIINTSHIKDEYFNKLKLSMKEEYPRLEIKFSTEINKDKNYINIKIKLIQYKDRFKGEYKSLRLNSESKQKLSELISKGISSDSKLNHIEDIDIDINVNIIKIKVK